LIVSRRSALNPIFTQAPVYAGFAKVLGKDFSELTPKIRLKYAELNLFSVDGRMSEETVTVNKKGQFTIPARFRKEFRIQEGTRLLVTQDEYVMTLRRVPEFDDLLGLHSGKITYLELVEELGQMRKQDRY